MKKVSKKKKEERDRARTSKGVLQGRDEMNLVEFPFATLSRRPTMGSITCQRWIEGDNGQRHKQRWVVQGGSASGLPTEFDERVYVALMAISREQGFASRKVPFSVYRLLKIMGEATDTRHYRSVERSLERLLRASIVAEGAFWDAERKALVHLANGFHLVERYWLAYQETDQAVVEREDAQAYLVWGQEIWRSIASGYLKRLDLRFFFSLQTPGARRLYRFLDKKLHGRAEFEIDIFQLSQQLGMAYYRYPAKVREKLQPGIDELIASGYLARAEMVKVQGYTRMRFVKGQRPRRVMQVEEGKEQKAVQSGAKTQDECGHYGCTAKHWRRRAALAHSVGEEYLALWERVLKRIRRRISTVIYQAWIARTLLVDLDGGRATILVPNRFLAGRLSQEHEALIRKALRDELRTDLTLVVRPAQV